MVAKSVRPGAGHGEPGGGALRLGAALARRAQGAAPRADACYDQWRDARSALQALTPGREGIFFGFSRAATAPADDRGAGTGENRQSRIRRNGLEESSLGIIHQAGGAK